MEGNISETRQSLPSRRALDTISEASAKPPLKQNSKNIDEPRKGRKKREEHILKLSRKKKDKAKKEIEQKFMSSMSTTLHPMLQLADESIQKINNQLNYNSLHHNSVCLKSASKNKKRKGIKIGNKVSYIIGPGNKVTKPATNMSFSSKFLKTANDGDLRKHGTLTVKDEALHQILDTEQYTDRKSDATTLKETNKCNSEEKAKVKRNKTLKRKKSKQKSENYYLVNSPPHSQIE